MSVSRGGENFYLFPDLSQVGTQCVARTPSSGLSRDISTDTMLQVCGGLSRVTDEHTRGHSPAHTQALTAPTGTPLAAVTTRVSSFTPSYCPSPGCSQSREIFLNSRGHREPQTGTLPPPLFPLRCKSLNFFFFFGSTPIFWSDVSADSDSAVPTSGARGSGEWLRWGRRPCGFQGQGGPPPPACLRGSQPP